jgi:hypothetical protein
MAEGKVAIGSSLIWVMARLRGPCDWLDLPMFNRPGNWLDNVERW